MIGQGQIKCKKNCARLAVGLARAHGSAEPWQNSVVLGRGADTTQSPEGARPHRNGLGVSGNVGREPGWVDAVLLEPGKEQTVINDGEHSL